METSRVESRISTSASFVAGPEGLDHELSVLGPGASQPSPGAWDTRRGVLAITPTCTVVAASTDPGCSLAFRDYLREQPAAAREYERLKQDLAMQLAATDRESRDAYTRAKTDFIERTVAMALSSGYPREFLQAGELPKAPKPKAS
jgi:hypothetical protein